MNNQNGNGKSGRRIPVSVIILAFLCGVFFVRGFSYRGFDRFIDSSNFVSQRYRMLENLRSIPVLLKDDESSMRGYLLSGKDDYLAARKVARDKLTGIVAISDDDEKKRGTLQVLLDNEWLLTRGEAFTEWNRSQFNRLQALGKVIDERLEYTQMLVDVAGKPTRSDALFAVRPKTPAMDKLFAEMAEQDAVRQAATGQDTARAMFTLSRGQALWEPVLRLVHAMEQEESKALHERLEEVRESAMFQADVMVVVHFAFIAVVVGGLVLILIGAALGWKWVRNPWFRFTHLAMILFVIGEIVVNFECPLTTWERDLKYLAGLKPKEGGFIARWMHQMVIYDEATMGEDGPVFMAGYIIFGLLVLGSFWLAPPRLGSRSDCGGQRSEFGGQTKPPQALPGHGPPS